MNILVVNQYFPPDQAATGQLLGQLVEDLAVRNEVTVICGSPTYAPDAQASPPPGVKVIRIRLLARSRAGLFVRIANYAIFMCGALARALTLPRHDVVMCWTDPPVVGLVGALVKHAKHSKFVFVSQDVYPEVAQAAGRMSNPVSLFILGASSRSILRWADRIVAVGDGMRRRLTAKGVPESRITVIPNWQDLAHLTPVADNAFRARHGIPENSFVVMHSGNLGLSQDFDTFLSAAALTKKDSRIRYLIAGDGSAQKQIVRRMERDGLSNVTLLPYQPRNELPRSLGAADLHYVSLRPAFDGCVVPSKIYGVMAAGRAVLANVPPGNEIETIVKDAECGFLSSPDPNRLAQAVSTAAKDPTRVRRMGKNARAWIEANGGRPNASERYLQVLEEVVGS